MDLNTDDTFHVICDCSDPYNDHSIIFHRDNDFPTDDNCYYVVAKLNHYLGFWKRLCVATKYVLGIDNTYCQFTETVINQECADKLIAFLSKDKKASE